MHSLNTEHIQIQNVHKKCIGDGTGWWWTEKVWTEGMGHDHTMWIQTKLKGDAVFNGFQKKIRDFQAE